MYSYDDRIRAVKLYIKLGKRAATAIRMLGYPSRKYLRQWYLIYRETGDLPRGLQSPSEVYRGTKADSD
jgi:transposase-like protein